MGNGQSKFNIIQEATEKGTANDFWLVFDCEDSINYKDYLHRTNTQGLIEVVLKLSKSKKTRTCLDTLSLFNKDDRDQAEKEAKRRVKEVKSSMQTPKVDQDVEIEPREKSTVNESTTYNKDCDDCIKHKEDYEHLAEKAKNESKILARNNPKLAKSSASMSSYYNEKATEGCGKCNISESDLSFEEYEEFLNDDPLEENYYSQLNSHEPSARPVNVASKEPTLGDRKTDNTVYGQKNNLERIYKPSKQEANPTEDNRQVKVPSDLLMQLKDSANESRRTAENLVATKTEDKKFYIDLAVAFDDLHNFLEKGTVHGVKEAQIFMTSLMGPMLYRIPSDVATFIAQGGQPMSLKSYINNITVPMSGYGASGELDKL